MKILSKKKYNKILDDCKELQKKVEELKKANESLKEKLDDEKTSCKPNDCKSNAGSDFCNICEFGYLKVRNPIGTDIYACSKTVPCEDFKKKESR